MAGDLLRPKSSGKPRKMPQFPGIGGHSSQKMGFMELGEKLYNLVGVELDFEKGSLDDGKGVPGAIGFEGKKWGLGIWHDMANPFEGMSAKYRHEFDKGDRLRQDVGVQISRRF